MTIFSDEPLGDETHAPWPALALGGAGLLPFIALTAALYGGWADAGALARALLVYGAVILSFLGGTWWGLALNERDGRIATQMYVVAVLPSIWAWAAFALSPPLCAAMLAAGFAAMGFADSSLAVWGPAPTWYGRFRVALSLVVTLCLGAAFFKLPG